MNTTCETCEHFRPFRPQSQLLARDVGVTSAEVVKELLEIMKDERQKKDEEASLKLESFQQSRDDWGVRPVMSDHCGLREREGVFLIAELKNVDGRCGDHRPRGPARACEGCRHKAPGAGFVQDQMELAKLAALKATAGLVDSGAPDATVAGYLELTASLKTFELAQAYYTGRFTIRKPDYLPICGKLSGPQSYLPCAALNPHDACAEWDDGRAAEPPSDDEIMNAVRNIGKRRKAG